MKKIALVCMSSMVVPLFLVGCSSEASQEASAADIEQAAVAAVRATYQQESQVDCGGKTLSVEAGASVDCAITLAGEPVSRSALVQVASLTDEGYTVDVAITPEIEEPLSDISADEVRSQVLQSLTNEAQVEPAVNCLQGLERVVGASVTCSARFTGEDQTRSAQVTVKSVTAAGRAELGTTLSPSIKEKALSDSRDSVAAVVASALEGQLGAKPDVSCGDGYIEVRGGSALTCSVTSASGQVLGDAQVKLRDVSGGAYGVDVALEQASS